ncbi:MAG TPA: tyrosine-type recombinase/integrase [Acidimicrobiia bacterium]
MTSTPETAALMDSWSLALHDKADSTRRFYRACLEGFAGALPEGRGLLDVTRQDVQRYLAALKAEGKAQSTLRSRWIAFRSFYAWAAAEDEIADNPTLGVKVERANPPPTRIPDDADLRLLLKACAGKGFAERRDLALIRTAAATGARISELCALHVADVDLRNRLIVIRHGKGDKARVARVDPETGAALDRYIRTRARQRLAALPELFLTRFGPLGRKGADAMLKRRCTEAGIPPTHFHALRHRFADQWLARGGDEGALAQLGGWTDPAVMRRYGAARATDRALASYDQLGGVL